MKEQNRQWDAKAKDLVDYKQISLDVNQRTNIGYEFFCYGYMNNDSLSMAWS